MTAERSGGLTASLPRAKAKDVECPVCEAPKAEPCRGSAYSGRSHRAVQSHYARVQATKESAS